MMASDNIVDVTEADFEIEVLEYSEKTPVVVDFWAEWCVPCRTLSPLLEKLANEAMGSFRLAKVNVDENPNLAQRYLVRSIPAVKAFRERKIISEFVGVQPELRLREFIRAIVPSPADLAIEKGESLLLLEDWRGAEKAFRQALETAPGQPPALLGLAKSLLAQGKAGQALTALILNLELTERAAPPEEAARLERLRAEFPVSRELAAAERIRPLAEALYSHQNSLEYLDEPLEAAYHRALRLINRGNLPAAMDGLLDILRQDKRFRGGEVHQLILALLEIMGETETPRQYRRELASVLF